MFFTIPAGRLPYSATAANHTFMKKLTILLALACLTACQKSLDERLKDETKEWTETNCPKQIDEITTLDSMTYDAKRGAVQYWYKVSGMGDSPLFWAEAKGRMETIKQEYIKDIRQSTEIKELVARERSFEYIYTSASNGNRLFTVFVTPEDYK